MELFLDLEPSRFFLEISPKSEYVPKIKALIVHLSKQSTLLQFLIFLHMHQCTVSCLSSGKCRLAARPFAGTGQCAGNGSGSGSPIPPSPAPALPSRSARRSSAPSATATTTVWACRRGRPAPQTTASTALCARSERPRACSRGTSGLYLSSCAPTPKGLCHRGCPPFLSMPCGKQCQNCLTIFEVYYISSCAIMQN